MEIFCVLGFFCVLCFGLWVPAFIGYGSETNALEIARLRQKIQANSREISRLRQKEGSP